jgi:undecaprenyl-diphosphatase
LDILQLFLLAVIQGLTEFLPVSSSAHLIIPAQLFDLHDQGLAFDVAVHLGSLVAVLSYFRAEIYKIIMEWIRSLRNGISTPESRLGWWLIIGSAPVSLAGLLFGDLIEQYLRSMLVIAIATIFFGIVLGVADTKGSRKYQIDNLNWRSAFAIGVAQMLALIPGTSRSGITMTAALALGFERREAARYSFFLAIPVIVLSGVYKAMQLGQESLIPWYGFVMGIVISALTALLCIHFFLSLINRVGMMPFVWYRLALGAGLLIIVQSSGN